jgi:hypothetical protein
MSLRVVVDRWEGEFDLAEAKRWVSKLVRFRKSLEFLIFLCLSFFLLSLWLGRQRSKQPRRHGDAGTQLG